MLPRASRTCFLCLGLLWPLGCSGGDADSESAETAGAGGQPGGAGGSASEPVADAFECAPPGHASVATRQPFSSLSAVVVDLNDSPIPNVHAQACGLDLCLKAEADETGSVSIVNEAELTAPAFKYGLGREYAKFAYRLGPGADHDLGQQRTVALPASGDALEPGTAPSSAGVTLDLPAEMNRIRPDPFDYDTDALKAFRAVEVPVDLAPDAVDPTLGLERIVALSPVGVKLCPAPTLSIDNTESWEAGTAVDVYLHGVEISEEWAPYGGWAKVATAHVDDTGSSIVTDDGEGLPIISVIGLKRSAP